MKKIIWICCIVLICFACKDNNQGTKTTTGITVTQKHGIQLSSGKIDRITKFPSKYISPRPVDIWLPDGYTKDKTYSVLYMHDGQMLFDATTTWNKQEWKVDEWASKLMKEKKVKEFIVVAVHNISKIRWNDYFPQKAFDFLTKVDQDSIKAKAEVSDINITMHADKYLQFLTEELKPYIDSHYSVYTSAKETAIAGSSMGGLISMYAQTEYPSVFGAAACISTHWPGMMVQKDSPIPSAIFAYMRAHIPSSQNNRYYFDFGTETLDQYYPQYEETVNTIFQEKGYDADHFVNLRFEGADHSENSWNQRLDKPFTFLFAL